MGRELATDGIRIKHGFGPGDGREEVGSESCGVEGRFGDGGVIALSLGRYNPLVARNTGDFAKGSGEVVGCHAQDRRCHPATNARICPAPGHAGENTEMNDVTIRVSERWVRLARSPFAWFATALSGVSVSFAPLGLYFYGKGLEPVGPSWFGVPLCWVIILVCGFFHMKLAQHVMRQMADVEIGGGEG